MTKDPHKRHSKFMSLVLRHQPATAGLTLDGVGWVEVDQLLSGLVNADLPLSLPELQQLVASNDKQRFEFSDDGLRIRARQGHSLPVDLEYVPTIPPSYLYHGTAQKSLPTILVEGLQKMKRHHVHLSADSDLAHRTGGRHGSPVVLRIFTGKMHAEGHVFYVTENHVWMTDHVPSRFIEVHPALPTN